MGDDIYSIAGKRTVITGGASGIGLGIAKRFIAEAAEVVIANRRAESRSIAEAIHAGFVLMDVSEEASVRDGLIEAAGQLGGIDVLILNAGIDLAVGVAGSLDLPQFRRVMDVNVMGVVYGLAFGPSLMTAGGTVLITSSPAGRLTVEGLSAYSASKAALDSLARTAAIELGPQGIRVNAVLPGVVKTEMSGGPTGAGDHLAMLTATGIQREPHEIAPVFQFLASDAASAITGATIQADDGMTAGLSIPLIKAAFGDSGLG